MAAILQDHCACYYINTVQSNRFVFIYIQIAAAVVVTVAVVFLVNRPVTLSSWHKHGDQFKQGANR